jgi:hypothetical protein
MLACTHSFLWIGFLESPALDRRSLANGRSHQLLPLVRGMCAKLRFRKSPAAGKKTPTPCPGSRSAPRQNRYNYSPTTRQFCHR